MTLHIEAANKTLTEELEAANTKVSDLEAELELLKEENEKLKSPEDN